MRDFHVKFFSAHSMFLVLGWLAPLTCGVVGLAIARGISLLIKWFEQLGEHENEKLGPRNETRK